MARRGDELPAVERVTVVDEHRIALEADERPVDVAGADQLLRDLGRDAVGDEPVGDPLRPVRVVPDELALGVVERALVDRRAGQLGDVGGRADVVGVEVGDEDPRHLGAVERRGPDLLARRAGRCPVSTSVQPSSPGSRYEWTWPGRVGSGVVIRRMPCGSSIGLSNTIGVDTNICSILCSMRAEYREEPCRSALNRVKGMPFALVPEPVHRLRPPLHVLLRPRVRAAGRPAGRRPLRPLDPRQGERRRGARSASSRARRGGASRSRSAPRPIRTSRPRGATG